MKIRASSCFLIVIMAMMLATIGYALRMDYFKSKLLPIVVSSIVFILAAVALKQEGLTAKEQKINGIGLSASQEPKERRHAYLFTGIWVISFTLAIYLVGFLIAIPLFIFAYMRSHGIDWFTAIIFAILTPAFIYGIFEFAVGITLYPGLLFASLG
jgi:hypothetical protein